MFEEYYRMKEEEQSKRKLADMKKEKPVRTEIDKRTWKVGRITCKAVDSIKRATLRKGGYKDTVMTIVIDAKDLHLFTIGVENRLLALFRSMYKDIVLLNISSPAEDARRRREILLVKAQREHRKREKQHLKSLDSANKCNTDTLF